MELYRYAILFAFIFASKSSARTRILKRKAFFRWHSIDSCLREKDTLAHCAAHGF